MHHIRHAICIGLSLTVADALASNENNRDPLNEILLFHIIKNLEPIHDRHHNIQQDQDDVCAILNLCDCLLTILRFQDFILLAEHFRQYGTVYFFIINNQNLLLIHTFPSSLLLLFIICYKSTTF